MDPQLDLLQTMRESEAEALCAAEQIRHLSNPNVPYEGNVVERCRTIARFQEIISAHNQLIDKLIGHFNTMRVY